MPISADVETAAATTSRHFSGPGSNLGLVAATAAIELDNLSLGVEVSPKAVPALAAELLHAVNQPTVEQSARALLDPVTVDVFSRALTRASVGPMLQSVGEMTESIRGLAARLDAVPQSTLSVDELRELRDYCVSLSQSAQGRSTPRDESRPNKYRR